MSIVYVSSAGNGRIAVLRLDGADGHAVLIETIEVPGADAAAAISETKLVSMLRTSSVFNVAQVEGLTEVLPKPEALPELDRMAAVDAFVGATKAEIRTGGNQPMYVPSQDFIAMPALGQFRNANNYYATLLHECGHYAERRIMPHGRCECLGERRPVVRRLGIISGLSSGGCRWSMAPSTSKERRHEPDEHTPARRPAARL
jgi:hypothetical protein